MNDDQRQQTSLCDDDAMYERLVRAACELVEYGGAAALADTGRLAQTAATSLAAVRDHFPTHDDLLLAVADDFYRSLDGRIAPSVQETAAEQIVRGGLDAREATQFIEAIWDTLAHNGPAVLIVRTADAAPTPEPHREPRRRLFARYDARWLRAIARAGYSELDCGIMLAMIISQTKTFAVLLRRGEITRSDVVANYRGTLEQLVHDYRRVAGTR